MHRYLHVKVGRVWVRYWKVYTLFLGGDKTGVDLVLIFFWQGFFQAKKYIHFQRYLETIVYGCSSEMVFNVEFREIALSQPRTKPRVAPRNDVFCAVSIFCSQIYAE